MTGETSLALAVVANLVIALSYVGIGLWIAPRFNLTGSRSKTAKLAKLFGMAFFISCAFTHMELAYHATEIDPVTSPRGVGDWFTSWHGFVIHGVQATAGIGFLLLARKALSVRIYSRSLYEDMIEEYLTELEAIRAPGKNDDDPEYVMWAEMIHEVIREPGAMETMYQPIVNLASGQRVGFEALTRFPGYQDYNPEQWFIAASRYGLERPLEIAAAMKAVDGINSFEQGAYLTLNVSQDTFLSLELIEALATRGKPAHRYVLELTELVPIVRYKPLQEAAALVRHMGARVAVDDLGSGFATMRRIIELQPEMVKIDKALSREVVTSEHQRALLRNLVGYARDMGVTVVVEGIENEQQVQVLRSIGVRFGQGYHLGRPAPLHTWT